MPSDKPRIVFYTDAITKKKLDYIAKKDNRYASNYLDILIQKHIDEYEQINGEIQINE